jgi:cytochrome c peroxidase
MSGHAARAAVVACLLPLLGACGEKYTPTDLDRLDGQIRPGFRAQGIEPYSPPPPQDPALVDLGRALFFDKILSGNRDASCATCHDPALATTDGKSLAVGTGAVHQGGRRVLGPGRQYVPRNAPSLLNLSEVPMLMWDGRIRTTAPGVYATPAGSVLPTGLTSLLAAQAMFPVLARTELRGNAGDRDVFGALNELAEYDDSRMQEIWDAVMRRLLSIEGYVAKFAAAYPNIPTDRLGFEHAANAIAAFELEAFSPSDTPFDRYLAGDLAALSPEAKRGANIFVDRQCQYCHFTKQFAGLRHQIASTGTPQLGPGMGSMAPLDAGTESPLFAFRVPPLRNVELTAPYGHAGAYATLEAVVRHYGNPEHALRTYEVQQLDPGLRSAYHGDDATRERLLQSLDGRLVGRAPFTEGEVRLVVAFLRSLTDPSVRNLGHLVPSSVPSGLPVR